MSFIDVVCFVQIGLAFIAVRGVWLWWSLEEDPRPGYDEEIGRAIRQAKGDFSD